MSQTSGVSENRFAEITLQYGGRFDFDSVPLWIGDQLRTLLDGYKRRLLISADRMIEPQSRSLFSSVHVGYVANFQPNALIFPDSHGFAMAVFVGLPIVLLEALSIIFHDPAIIRLTAQDLCLPTSAPDVNTCRFFDWIRRSHLADEPPPLSAVRPIDESRLTIIRHAFGLLMDFVFEHEMAHVRQGHVEFANSSPWIEQMRGSDLVPNWRQALEIDADSIAVGTVLERLFSNPELADDFGGDGQLLRIWFVCLTVITHVLDPLPAKFPLGTGTGYPHPSIRLLNLVQITAGAILRFAPELQVLIENVMEFAAYDSQSIANYAQFSESAFQGLVQYHNVATDYVSKYHREIEALEPELTAARHRMYQRTNPR